MVICNHCGKGSYEVGGQPICCHCGKKIAIEAERVRDARPTSAAESERLRVQNNALGPIS